jgi:amino acid permease
VTLSAASDAELIGVAEYWLASLKVATIVIFIILGIAVNCGANPSHAYLGAHYWHIPGAPFVGGFAGFARVFVTASFACASPGMHGYVPLLTAPQTAGRRVSGSQQARRATRAATCRVS